MVATGRSSCASDTYAFGVFLLELISGREALWLARQPKGDQSLYEWVRGAIACSALGRFVDMEVQVMGMEGGTLQTLTHLALLCLQPDPQRRPTMGECVCVLEGEGVLEEAWDMWGEDIEYAEDHDLMSRGSEEEEEEEEEGDACKEIFAGLLSGLQDEWSGRSSQGMEVAPR